MKHLLFIPGLIVRRNMVIKVLLLPIIIFLIDNSNYAQEKIQKEKIARQVSAKVSKAGKHQLSFKIIPSEQNSYGYEILLDNRPLVHQPSIPGIPGNKGFTEKKDAEKCARLVMDKISRNIMPPTVTVQELDSLKIKF